MLQLYKPHWAEISSILASKVRCGNNFSNRVFFASIALFIRCSSSMNMECGQGNTSGYKNLFIYYPYKLLPITDAP